MNILYTTTSPPFLNKDRTQRVSHIQSRVNNPMLPLFLTPFSMTFPSQFITVSIATPGKLPESQLHLDLSVCVHMLYLYLTFPPMSHEGYYPVNMLALLKGYPTWDEGACQLTTPGKLGSTSSPAAPSSHQGLLLNNQLH